MFNGKAKKFIKSFLKNEKSAECNDSEVRALLELGESIKSSSSDLKSGFSYFQERLKAEILEGRHKQKNPMLNSITRFCVNMLQPKKLTPVVAFVVLIALIFSTINLRPNGGPLLINTAYAHDNFDVTATESDSIGITKNSGFMIKSKQAITNVSELEKNISIIPEVGFDLERISDYEFRLVPKDDLQDKRVYRIEIASAYVAENGITSDYTYSWAFQVKDVFKVIGSMPRNKSTGVPANSGIEITLSHGDFTDFEKAFSIIPAVEGRFEKHDRTMVFVPKKDFEAGEVYTVKISKDIKLNGSDEQLAEEYLIKFETAASQGAHDRNISSYKDVVEFGTDMAPVFNVSGYGVEEGQNVDVMVYAFKSQTDFIEYLKIKNQIPGWATYSRDKLRYDLTKLDFVSQHNVPLIQQGYLYYAQLPSELPKGYYLAQLKNGDSTAHIFTQITDLAAYANVNTNKTLVWVNSLKTGKTVADASVTDGAVNVKTDSNGIAIMETKADEKELTQERYFTIKSGDESLVMPVSFYYSGESASGKYWNYLYTDRYMYKPEDAVNFWGFIKTRDGNMELPKGIKANLISSRSLDYYYNPVSIHEQEISINQDGSFAGEIKLNNLTPDYYQLELSIGEQVISNTSVYVETYDKPLYKIDVESSRKAVFAGEQVDFKIKTEFYEGTPVSNLELSYSYDNEKGEIKTDENGEAVKSIRTAKKPCNDCYLTDYAHLFVEPKQAEAGNIRAESYLTIFNSRAQFADNKLEQLPGSNRARITAGVKEVDLDNPENGYIGKGTAGKNVSAEVSEIIYTKEESGEYYDFINKTKRKTYKYKQEEVRLHGISFVTDAQGIGSAEFDVSPEKTYVVKLHAYDNQGTPINSSLYLYAMKAMPGEGEAYEHYYIKSKNDTQKYKIGEKVEIDLVLGGKKINEPRGSFLYSLSHLGLMDYKVKNNTEHDFTFTAEMVPNVYVSAVWFDGDEYKHFNSWGADFYFDTKESILDVSIAMDKDKYKPGEKAKLDIKVADKDGRPVKAAINIDLVDAALEGIGKYMPDPLGGVYQFVSSGNLTKVSTHYYPKIGGGAEGGGCFLTGTQIRMADGSTKGIEGIKIGDEIRTFASETDRSLAPGKVSEVFRHIVRGYLVINDRMHVTPEHRIFINNSWRQIGEAKIGDILIDENGNRIKIFSIEKSDNTVVVYNFKVEKYHTYFADGIYVHNDKGGIRQNFADVALFTNTVTDENGKATVEVKLPDNITSWLVTAQAIAGKKMVEAGAGTAKLPVSLPLFVEQTIPEELIAKDQPDLKVRAYGDSLKSGNDVRFNFSSESLGIKETEKQGKAFVPAYFELPGLAAGKHKIKTTAASGNNDDTVIKEINVVGSRLMENVIKGYKLETGLKIEGSQDGMTDLVFADKNSGQMFWMLESLLSGGKRLDQKIGAIAAQKLLKEYFDIDSEKEEFNGSAYQYNGGITLLPYSSADLDLSAKVAALHTEEFDSAALSGFFYSYLNNYKSNRDESIAALYGLASLDEPVLLPIRDFAKINDLTPKQKLYLGLAAHELGDEQLARRLYEEIVKEKGEKIDPYLRLNVSKNEDENLEVTLLAAILGAGLDDKNADGFWRYVQEKNTKDILTDIEKVLYIEEALPHLKSGSVSFKITIDGKMVEKKLDRGESFFMPVTASQLQNMSFSDVVGDVDLVSRFGKITADMKNSDLVSIKREYHVKGKKTDVFKQGDIVEIWIYPDISSKSVGGLYQVTDLLPSGLQLVSNLYDRGLSSGVCGIRYPYEVNGQKVKFIIGQSWNKDRLCSNSGYFRYFARVTSTGKFIGEPAAIESLNSNEVKSYSNAGVITIER